MFSIVNGGNAALWVEHQFAARGNCVECSENSYSTREHQHYNNNTVLKNALYISLNAFT